MRAKKNTIRTFFAVPLDDAIRFQIGQAIAQLQTLPGGQTVRWEAIEKLHITLHFLGATDEADLPELLAEVKNRVENLSSFKLHIGPVVPFPNAHHPHVIAMALTPEDPLIALAQAVEQGVMACGYPKEERRYHPHLTLGRLSHPHWPFPGNLPPALGEQVGTMLLRECVLLRSDPGEATTRYSMVGRIGLKV